MCKRESPFLSFWRAVDVRLLGLGEPPARFGEVRQYEASWWTPDNAAAGIALGRVSSEFDGRE